MAHHRPSNGYPSGFFSSSSSQRLPPPPPPPPPPGLGGTIASPPPYMHPYGHSNAYPYTNTSASVPFQTGGYSYGSVQRPPQNHFHHSNLQQSNANLPPSSEIGVPNARSSNFHCKPCQLTFDSAGALQAHTTSHITCNECDFNAAPKVVKAHHSAVHGKFSGAGFKSVTIAIPGVKVQRFSICVGNHPDDIQQWISERRKRFPRQSKPTNDPTTQPPVATGNKHETSQPGLSMLLEGYGTSSSDDNDEDNRATKEKVSKEPKAPTNAGQPMIGMPTLTTPTVATDALATRFRTRPCRFFMRNGKCRNGDNCNFSHESILDTRQQLEPTKVTSQGNVLPATKKRRSNDSSPTKTSLLHNLLANDVRREAILTFQLLDFIVESNFFQEIREK